MPKQNRMADDLVMDRFRVGDRIGAGGMGVVYRAFDERLRREVAVKEINAAEPERVLREAQAAARLNHPGIVTLYELGRRGERALLVSELVRGSTLDRLHAAGRLTDRAVAEVGAELCEALAHAHDRGVVHRDLKPQNVIVADEDGVRGAAKLMDFGIARVAGSPALTATGEVVGTLAYMAPEQAEGLAAEPPADVYSLALTLYECWAGENPVAGHNPAATARRIGRPVDRLGDRRPDLPPHLAATVDACLSPEPERRPVPDELRDALLAALPGLAGDRPVPAPGDSDPGLSDRGGRLVARLLPTLALAGGLVLLAGPGGLPGAALVAAALLAPAVVFLPRTGIALLLGAPVLGALGALGAYPAAAAHAGHRPAQRALAGALGWSWTLAAGIALGAGSWLGIAPGAPSGWESSATEATSTVLAPLLEPAALLGAGTFGLAALILGRVLAARHLALGALGALVWAACLVAALSLVADGSLADGPVVAAVAAALSVAAEGIRRSVRRPLRAAPPHPVDLDRRRPGARTAGAGIRAVS